MKRKIYQELLNWKNNQDHVKPLMVLGVRQSGKTYIIDEFCKKTSSYLYKNTSIDYMSIGAFKAEGQWYIIK